MQQRVPKRSVKHIACLSSSNRSKKGHSNNFESSCLGAYRQLLHCYSKLVAEISA